MLLKQIKCEISPYLTLLLNQCLTTGIFPEKLKIAKIIPIFKKVDAQILNNYRPISLLPTISKLFERVIYNQLYNYLNIHDIITSCQYGFRRHHSTELAAIELVDRTTSELDHYKIPFNIYIDMSKAFDLIDFTVLLHKLSHYGIHDTALKLLKSYLTDRKQYCYYKGTSSSTVTTSRGDYPRFHTRTSNFPTLHKRLPKCY